MIGLKLTHNIRVGPGSVLGNFFFWIFLFVCLFVRKNQNISYMAETNFVIESSCLAYIKDLNE